MSQQYSDFVRSLQLLDIGLFSSHMDVGPFIPDSFADRKEEDGLRVNLETIIDSEDQEQSLIVVLLDVATWSTEGRDKDILTRNIYKAVYKRETTSPYNPDFMNRYAETSTVYQLWPHIREMVVNLTQRSGERSVILPLNISLPESGTSADDPEAT